jgi:hypothetical protein
VEIQRSGDRDQQDVGNEDHNNTNGYLGALGLVKKGFEKYIH